MGTKTIRVTHIVGGDITVTTGSVGHQETRFTLQGGTVETHNITGTLDQEWMIQNGYYDGNNYAWTKNITQADIGNTVTSIGSSTFDGCSSLTSVTIPDGVTNIGGGAFYNCSGIASLTIPNSVTSIGDDAFYGCIGLTSLSFIGKTLEQVQNIEYTDGEKYYTWGIEDTSISIINVA